MYTAPVQPVFVVSCRRPSPRLECDLKHSSAALIYGRLIPFIGTHELAVQVQIRFQEQPFTLRRQTVIMY